MFIKTAIVTSLAMLKGLNKWKVLNSKEVRSILKTIKQQWGTELSFDHGFLEGKDGDIFLISRDVERLDLERLHLESLGLYFGQLRNSELRLSIEGSQLVGKAATKNVVELTGEEFKQWLRGEDVEKQLDSCIGYVLIKHNSDFVGCGKYKEGKILNFVPKARRVANL
ncbi:hypothetical protein HYV83_01270 [Candidatus Woesearchaeota archaeon]|nr:hypothetical protein [Candidatus Woesearchaeota archaeon]